MDSNFYKSYFELEKSNWWFLVRRNIIFSLLAEYFKDKKIKILDFGCGSGFLADIMRKRGYESFGVDMSDSAIEYGMSLGFKNISAAKDEKLPFQNDYFDCVTALDVLEHLEDETIIIKEISRVLKKDGTFIVMVPAFQFLWGLQDEVAHHHRRYDMGTIISAINRSSDFKIIRKTYFNTFLFLPVAMIRLAGRVIKPKRRESDFDINNSFLNKLLYRIFNAEAGLLRHINFPFGISILLVLKKNG